MGDRTVDQPAAVCASRGRLRNSSPLGPPSDAVHVDLASRRARRDGPFGAGALAVPANRALAAIPPADLLKESAAPRSSRIAAPSMVRPSTGAAPAPSMVSHPSKFTGSSIWILAIRRAGGHRFCAHSSVDPSIRTQ